VSSAAAKQTRPLPLGQKSQPQHQRLRPAPEDLYIAAVALLAASASAYAYGELIAGSGNTQPSAADPLSSGSTSCSADQRGETQHLAVLSSR